MSDEFSFSLKGARSLEVFADIRAEVIAALRPSRAVAEAVGSIVAEAARPCELMRAALACDLGALALSVETIRAKGAEWRAAFEQAGRVGLAGALADGYGDGRAAARAIAATAFRPPAPRSPTCARIRVIHVVREPEDVPRHIRAPRGSEDIPQIEETPHEWEM